MWKSNIKFGCVWLRFSASPHSVLWVRAETREMFLADLTALAALLHLPERLEYDQRVMVEAVKRWLDSHDGWLLLVDNVEDIMIVADLLPATPRSHMILITRLQATGSIAQHVNIAPMNRDESMLFLLRRAKLLGQQTTLETASESIRGDAGRICQVLDGLPLALDQAGVYNALGPKSTFVAEILTNRANLSLAQGRWLQAEQECRRALAIYRKLWGRKKHLEIARVLSTLAKLAHYRGNNEQAESYYQQARTIRVDIQGADHAEVARSLREWNRLRETCSQASCGPEGGLSRYGNG